MSVPIAASTESDRREHHAILMLLIACVLWGVSFNWNKEAQALFGQRLAALSGDHRLEADGPATFLASRFLIAVILWAVIFPGSLRGWTPRTAIACALGGILLAMGMLLQHYGLTTASESLTAFLTSLTILFTPVLACVVLRHRVGALLWVSVGCATLGVALMSLFRPEGHFDRGALLGLLCAVIFSVHILVVDHFGKTEDSWRFSLGQFLTAGIIIGAYALLRPGGHQLISSRVALDAVSVPKLAVLLLLTVVFSTLVTFGIMFVYQPRTSPTRAALIYLSEPIFATIYAWVVADSKITLAAMGGAVLIILGNLMAELFARRGGGSSGVVEE